MESTKDNSQTDRNEYKKPIIGEITTVIVSGICPETKEETLRLFFENTRRSGGGEIKDLKRVQPDIAHVTFFSSQVVKSVLEKKNLKVDDYLLKLKEQKPVMYSSDKRKLFIENIESNTSEDNLTNYVEIITKLEVVNLVMGKKNNAMVTLSNEPDIDNVIKKAKTKRLEGALLKITQPPVCNSILITGISENTPKDYLELRFENPKYGGGEILDVIYQRSIGKAIISFLDPKVLETITKKQHILNDSTLTVRPYYPFMKEQIVEVEKIIKVNPDIMDHVSNRCDEEFSELFNFNTSELKYDEEKEELTIAGKKEINKIEDYFNEFNVKEIPVPKNTITESKNDVKEILAVVKENDKNTTYVGLDEEKQCIIVIGKKKEVEKYKNVIKTKMEELEKMKKIITTQITFDENKLVLMYALGFEEQFKFEPNIDVKFILQESAIEFKGPRELCNEAKIRALEEYIKIKEDYIELNKRQEHFLATVGLDDVNTCLKQKRIKAMVCLGKLKQGKAKMVYIDSEKFEEIVTLIQEKIFEECCTLEEKTQILQKEKWVEMKNEITNKFGIQISASENEGNVWLTGEKIKVQQALSYLKQFIKNIIVSEATTRPIYDMCYGRQTIGRQGVLGQQQYLGDKSKEKQKVYSTTKSSQIVQKDNKKPIIGEITTVIVSGINPETKENALRYFFENTRRSGGGDIKELKRIQPDIAHVTFLSPQVAKNVLEKGNLQVDGYLLKLKSQKPEVIFPPDKKKLFIENIHSKTSRDSLTNYIEIISRQDVVSLVLEKKNNAMVTLSDEPDINHVIEKAKTKRLDGALLKITQPPVCHSILITGIPENTTKDSLELKFENPKYGGEILDIIYQRSEGKAIISFLDPNVLETITTRKEETLTIRPCYPFMEDQIVDEVKKPEKIIKVNQDIMDHVCNRCEAEFLKIFNFSTSELKYDEEKYEVTIIGQNEIKNIEEYFNQFDVTEIPISPHIKEPKKKIPEILTATKENDKKTAYGKFDEEKHCIIVTGKKKHVKKYEIFVNAKLEELKEKQEVVSMSVSLDSTKLTLMYAFGFEKIFDSNPNIDVKINLQDGAVEVKGSKEMCNEAKIKALENYSKIKEDYIEMNERQEQFLASGGLNDVNTYLKQSGMKAMVFLEKSKQGEAKVVFSDSEKFENISSLISEVIFGRMSWSGRRQRTATGE